MRIKELALHNFRGIKDLQLVFNINHNVAILVGVNGIGKSSILDSINILIGHCELIRREGPFLDHFTDNKNKHNNPISLSDIKLGSDNSTDKIIINFGKQDITLEIDKTTNYQAYDSERIYWNLSEKIRREFDTKLKHFYCYYLSNRQVVNSHKIWEKESEEIIDFEYFSTWFQKIEDLENEQRLSDDIEYRHPFLSAVRRAVYSLLGEGYQDLRFKRAYGQMTIRKLGQEINIKLLSDGEKSLLAMVGHLSRELAENSQGSDNPLEASALVLIDEIELHLHPEWQRMVIPRLTKTFPNCQFIVTTHSPQVLSHVDPECIHILDYDGDNVIVKRPESSYGLDSNRILEDILGVSKRPQEIQDRMLELFRNINNNDLASAKKIVRELGDRIGINEPELVKAEATIKRREIIGR